MKRNTVALLLALLLAFSFIACRELSHKTYYVFKKEMIVRDGNSVFIIQLAKNERRDTEANPDFPKMRLEVSSEIYDALQEEKYYYPKELAKLGVDVAKLESQQQEQETFYLLIESRKEQREGKDVYVLIFVQHRYKNPKWMDNPRLRVETDSATIANMVVNSSYSLENLKELGINLPAEKPEK